jgi:hypothetical protein
MLQRNAEESDRNCLGGHRAAFSACSYGLDTNPLLCLLIALDLNSLAPIQQTEGVFSRGGGAAVMSMRLYVQPGAFGPEAIAAMSEAFDTACKAVHHAGQPSKAVREVLAQRIIAAATSGEHNPVRLRAAALAGLPDGEG